MNWMPNDFMQGSGFGNPFGQMQGLPPGGGPPQMMLGAQMPMYQQPMMGGMPPQQPPMPPQMPPQQPPMPMQPPMPPPMPQQMPQMLPMQMKELGGLLGVGEDKKYTGRIPAVSGRRVPGTDPNAKYPTMRTMAVRG